MKKAEPPKKRRYHTPSTKPPTYEVLRKMLEELVKNHEKLRAQMDPLVTQLGTAGLLPEAEVENWAEIEKALLELLRHGEKILIQHLNASPCNGQKLD